MTKKTSNRFSPEVRQRAVRMVLEHGGDHASQWAAIGSIAAEIGCTAETLRKWVRQGERDAGQRPGTTAEERQRIKALAGSRAHGADPAGAGRHLRGLRRPQGLEAAWP
jgi:transposase-like protein